MTIRDDEIVGITNIYGDGGSDNDSYIRRAINGTSSKAGVVDQIIKKGNLDGHRYSIQSDLYVPGNYRCMPAGVK